MAAGLNYYDWRLTDKYPQWFKTEVVVWHNNHMLVSSHMEAARSKAMERKSKKGKKG